MPLSRATRGEVRRIRCIALPPHPPCNESRHPPCNETPLPRSPCHLGKPAPAAYPESMGRPHLLFVTGKLAEPALRRVLGELAPRAGFDFSVAVLPITVAALATAPWIARHLDVPPGV